jgi:ferric iron reductase protein FhuF
MTSSARDGRGSSWRDGLVRRLDDLGSWTRRRFVLDPDPEDILIPAVRFFDRDHLRQAIAQTVPALRGRDLGQGGDADHEMRIAVSRFSRRYASFLSVPALVGLANGIGLDLSPERCTVVVRPDGQYHLRLDHGGEVLRCAQRPSPWPAGGGPAVESVPGLRDYVWRRLYALHLAPIFALALDIVPVAPRLVWSSAAEWAGMISDAPEERLDPEAALPYIDDRRALLGSAALPGVPGPNPLKDKLEWSPVPDGGPPEVVQTRRHCCITFLLEDRFGRLCDNCPYLSVEDRAALVRARRGRGAGGSPATSEERLIMRRAEELPVVARAMRARRRQR